MGRDIEIGREFGDRRVVAGPTVRRMYGRDVRIWTLRCSCGDEKEFESWNVGKSGRCAQCARATMKLGGGIRLGERNGSRVVVAGPFCRLDPGPRARYAYRWTVRCDCGLARDVRAANVRSIGPCRGCRTKPRKPSRKLVGPPRTAARLKPGFVGPPRIAIRDRPSPDGTPGKPGRPRTRTPRPRPDAETAGRILEKCVEWARKNPIPPRRR
jgi:hypothetical protein